MSDGEVLQFLSRLPHFRGLPRELVGEVAKFARVRSVELGETIFLQGEACTAFYAVRRGGVRVFRTSSEGREQVLHHIRPGQSFAEAAALTLSSYPASAQAVERDTELVKVPAEPFSKLIEREPRLTVGMVASLSTWLLGLVGRIEELSISSAPARLAHHLLSLPSRERDGHAVIQLPMTKKELAGHLAIAPETLSRILRAWKDRGVAESDGSELHVHDSRVLEALADGGRSEIRAT